MFMGKVKLIPRIRFLLFFLMIFLLTFYYHPYIFSLKGDREVGNVLSNYIIINFALLFFFCVIDYVYYGVRVISTFVVLLLFVSFFSLIIYSFFDNSKMFEELRPLLITVCAIIIGIQIKFSRKEIIFFLTQFVLLISFVGFMQVLMNVGGFEIKDIYLTDGKNALGASLATSVVIALLLLLRSNSNILKVIYAFLFVFCLVILLTIRARAALLTSFFLTLIILWNRIDIKYIKMMFLFLPLIFLVFICSYFWFPDFIIDYIENSLFAGNAESDFTSGRMDRNLQALSFLKDNLLLGNLQGNSNVSWIHNYPLLNMYNYGLIFSLPILILYLYLLFVILKNMYVNRNKDILCNVGFYVLLVPFVISMAEPTFPFGPGTATVFNFIIFGVSLKMCRENKYCQTY